MVWSHFRLDGHEGEITGVGIHWFSFFTAVLCCEGYTNLELNVLQQAVYCQELSCISKSSKGKMLTRLVPHGVVVLIFS